MVKTLKDCPSVFTDITVTDPEYLALNDEYGVYGHVLLNFETRKCTVHLSVSRWSASILKSMKSDWEEVKEICRSRDCKKLFAVNPAGEDNKWYRFIKHFGFDNYYVARVYYQEV